MINALITGIGGTNSVAILKALNASTVPHVSVGTDIKPINAGSFLVDRAYCIPRVDSDGYRAALENIIKKEDIKIIFATTETELAYLAEIKDELETAYDVIVMVADKEILRICQDKFATQKFLQENGFTYIPTILATTPETVKAFIEQHGFPLIHKPIQGYGSRGITFAYAQDDLKDIEYGEGYVLQQLIESDPQDEFEEFTTEIFINKDMSVAGGIIINRTLFSGESRDGRVIRDPAITEYLASIAQKLGIKGPCNFQYRIKDGKPYVFEINARYSGTTAVRAHYGFNNVELALQSFILGNHKKVLPEDITEGYFVRYWEEAYATVEQVKDLTETKFMSHE